MHPLCYLYSNPKRHRQILQCKWDVYVLSPMNEYSNNPFFHTLHLFDFPICPLTIMGLRPYQTDNSAWLLITGTLVQAHPEAQKKESCRSMTYGTFLFLTFQICTQIVANSEYYLWIFCNISHFLCACVVDYYLHSCYTFNKDCYFPIPLLLPVKELLIDFSLHDYLSCTFLRFFCKSFRGKYGYLPHFLSFLWP